MVSLFRNNDVINFLLLIPYAVVLRIYSLIYPTAYIPSAEDTIITKWIFTWISNPFIQSIIAILLVFAHALMINVMANNYRIHRLPTALAGMIYIFLASCIKELQVLTPALIGLTFILVAVFNVFKTYKLTRAAPNIFNASFSCALATIIYPPYIVVIIAFFVGFLSMRNFSLQERIQFLIGFGVLFWIAGAFLFAYDVLDWNFFGSLSFPGILNDFSWSAKDLWLNLGISGLLIFLSLVNYYNYMKKKVIDIRKKIDFFYWLLLCAFLSLFIFRQLDYQHYMILAVSLSIFLSMSLLLIKNKTLAELLHLVGLIAVFYFQFV